MKLTKTTSKGPGRLTLSSGLVNSREFALIQWSANASEARSLMERAKWAGIREAKQMRKMARVCAKIARDWLAAGLMKPVALT